MENHKKQRALEHDNVEKQLRQYTAKNQMINSELQYPLSVYAQIKLFSRCAPWGRTQWYTDNGGTVTKYFQIVIHVMICLS